MPVSDSLIVQYQLLSVDPPLPLTEPTIPSPALDTLGLSVLFDLPLANVLVVAGADTDAYAQYFRKALDSLRITFNMWNPRQSNHAPFSRVGELRRKALIFYTSYRALPPTHAVLHSLAASPTAGSNLFLKGQNIVFGNDSSALFLNGFGVSHFGTTMFSPVRGATRRSFQRNAPFNLRSGRRSQSGSAGDPADQWGAVNA